MSKKTFLACAAVVAMALPTFAYGQVGIGARAGTLGVGAEASIALGSSLAVRGGIGLMPISVSGEMSQAEKEYTIDFPSNVWSLGVDLYPTSGGLHLSAGILSRPSFDVTGKYTGSAKIGGQTYTGNVVVDATFSNDKEIGPFGSIGFGRTTKSGFGFSLDLGAAFMGDGTVDITKATCTQSSGAACPVQPSQSDIQAEETRLTTDLNDKGYLKIHPILSLSLHIGI